MASELRWWNVSHSAFAAPRGSSGIGIPSPIPAIVPAFCLGDSRSIALARIRWRGEQGALVRDGKRGGVVAQKLRVRPAVQLEARRGERMVAGEPGVVGAGPAVAVVIDAGRAFELPRISAEAALVVRDDLHGPFDD